MIEKNWLDLKKPDELEIKQSELQPEPGGDRSARSNAGSA